MKRKILTLVITLFITVFISSCNEREETKENDLNGEYIMDEANLTNSNVIDDNAEQLSKAFFPILVTLLGIVINVNEEQFWKAFFPISTRELGNTIELSV